MNQFNEKRMESEDQSDTDERSNEVKYNFMNFKTIA